MRMSFALSLALALVAGSALAQTIKPPPTSSVPSAGASATTTAPGTGVSVGVDVLGGLDGDSDGMLSRAEVQANPELSKRFRKLDRNNDGQLSADEYSQFQPKPGAGATPGVTTESSTEFNR